METPITFSEAHALDKPVQHNPTTLTSEQAHGLDKLCWNGECKPPEQYAENRATITRKVERQMAHTQIRFNGSLIQVTATRFGNHCEACIPALVHEASLRHNIADLHHIKLAFAEAA